MTRHVAFGIGANLGDPVAAVLAAIEELSAELDSPRASSLYRTRPVGGVPQDDYVNAVLVGGSDLTAHDLLALAHRIEQAHGRTREVRWGPRTLDIDLLAAGEEQWADEVLTVPHPRAHERAFVLVPWHDVAPEAVIPGRGTVAELVAAVADVDDVQRIEVSP